MIKVGDEVAFNVNYLRSTNQELGEVPFLRGKVIDVALDMKDCRLLTVLWANGQQSNVNELNLTNNTLLDATIGARYVGKTYI